MSKSQVKKTVMPDGLRVVTETIPTHHSVAIGIWVDVGSRYEHDDIAGTSHFLEHMVFKGTPKRNAQEIALFLERLGGVLNAFTSREHTCYHARVLDEHLPQAVALLSDIATSATLPAKEVVKERNVICEEIKDVHDTPHEHVHDMFTGSLWPGQAVGRPIMGSIDSVSRTTRATLASYRSEYYTANRVVIAASGSLTHDDVLRLVKKYVHFPKGGKTPVRAISPDEIATARQVDSRDIKQTHVCLGVPTWGFADKRRYPLLVANNLLGGGMSSRLFQTVREKRGLVYSIFAFHDFYCDAGHFGVYFACDPKNTVRATDLVLKEMSRLATTPISATELADVKSQLKGNMILGLESTSARMHRLARHELYLGRHIPVEETMKEIDSVSATQLMALARDAFVTNRQALSVVGPLGNDLVGRINWNLLRPKLVRIPVSKRSVGSERKVRIIK
ncbi:MAG: insulinase family protein [candidate division Zixibacteria bacterium]|nr:insulinase family protein [candidate division Zixibacteria bacterium]